MNPEQKRVLIVDDEAGIRDSLRLLLGKSFEVQTAADGAQALVAIDSFTPDLILLDVAMPNLGGLDTLRELRNRKNESPVIMLTAASTVKTAVEAMKLGALDYINKPFDVAELTQTIVNSIAVGGGATSTDKLGEQHEQSRRAELPAADFGPLVGQSPIMSNLFGQVEQIAKRDVTVLITGESGTGKELIARRIHDLSPRAKGPFLAINCAAIPETLIESELFGHEKGAFTHAIERRLGQFELADGGTLFLDEIGELSLAVQVKLLRFIQEREFFRIGRAKPLQVDVRIIAATNRHLEESIKSGRFRQDLYYRIHVVNLVVPALRDRFEDIPRLVEHFTTSLSASYSGRKIHFTEEAMKTLVEYAWPGNVRELENMVESLIALAPNDCITDEDLPRKVKQRSSSDGIKGRSGEDSTLSFEDAEKAFETAMIIKALRKTNYVQTRAAELLGISRRILKYKMDKLGISDKPADGLLPQEQASENSEESAT